MSITEARRHFGELIRKAQHGPVTIERYGKPVIFVLSKDEYDWLLSAVPSAGWRELLEQAHDLIRKEPVKHPLPDPAEVIRKMREERDEELGLH